MKIFNLFKKTIQLPAPIQYPNDNIPDWMEKKIAYFIQEYPIDALSDLFNPSCGDYIPKMIAVGSSTMEFEKNKELYRDIKKRYPEAVALAKEGFRTWSYYPYGDKEDYPDNLK